MRLPVFYLSMTDKTISIIGLGWLGLPLAERLISAGFRVKGSVTSTKKVIALEQRGIETHKLKMKPEPSGNLNALLQADTLVVNIPPKAAQYGDSFYPDQIQQLTEAIRQSPVEHVIYVSSTSVYPELSRVVTEGEITRPDESPSPALVRAEQFVKHLAPENQVTIVRFGGLMGYNRIPGKYVAGKTVDSGVVPVNYIHRDDAVGILHTLIARRITGTFNAVAPEHPTREAIYQKSCADLGLTPSIFVVPPEPVPYKVVSPEKLIRAIEYTFQYPNPLQFPYDLPPETMPSASGEVSL